jgi:hypothetical protein
MEIYIERLYHLNQVKVWLYEEQGDKDLFYGYKEGVLVQYTLQRGEPTNSEMLPFLQLPKYFFEIVLKHFAELASKEGVKMENEYKITGMLEAKEKHIEDLQKIALQIMPEILNKVVTKSNIENHG